jgi:hypothetical protein
MATQRSNGCTHKRQKAAKSDTHKRRQALTPGLFDGSATVEWLHPQATASAARAIRWQRNDPMAAPTSGKKRQKATPTSGDKR